MVAIPVIKKVTLKSPTGSNESPPEVIRCPIIGVKIPTERAEKMGRLDEMAAATVPAKNMIKNPVNIDPASKPNGILSA